MAHDYEEGVLDFKDVGLKAPVHAPLAVPREHVSSKADVGHSVIGGERLGMV